MSPYPKTSDLIWRLNCVMLLFEMCSTLHLAYNARCFVQWNCSNENLFKTIECQAAHYTQPVQEFKGDFTISSKAFSGIHLDSCHSRLMVVSQTSLILVLVRGGCSFYQKAKWAQDSGFRALVLVDNQEEIPIMPPGLGQDNDIHIPMVMISMADGRYLDLLNATYSGELSFTILFSEHDEVSLWESSPWHGKQTEQQLFYSLLSPDLPQWMPTCSPDEVDAFTDDGWLFKQWLEEVDCHNFLETLPTCNLHSVDAACIKRLTHFDSAAEYLPDPILLSNNKTLQGLNSNSHHFPFGGENNYPRTFKSFVIELRGGAYVDVDGVVVAQDGSAYHAGGCGCCPLQQGELMVKRTSQKPQVVRVKKLVSLVQRFQNVYYHFVLEILPRLMFVLEYALNDPEMLVLVENSNSFANYYLTEIMGLQQHQVLGYNPENIYFAEQLLLIPSPLPCGHVPFATIKALREIFLLQPESPRNLTEMTIFNDVANEDAAKPKMLILQRVGPRSINNFDELAQAVSKQCAKYFDVSTYDCENRSVAEQKQTFSSVSVLIASHGSGMSNAIFMLPNSVIVELLPWEYPNLTYYLLACAIDFPYYIYTVDNSNAYTAVDVNITDFLLQLVNQAIC